MVNILICSNDLVSKASLKLIQRDTFSDYSAHERQVIRICSISSSSVSILSGLVAFYFFGMILPKKKVFRHQLIFILIVFDFIKALVLLIYPATSEHTNESIVNNQHFLDAIGWFTSFSIEGADFIILCFAVHIALLIFKPNWKIRFRRSNNHNHQLHSEGGLYLIRFYIYAASVAIPVLLSSLTFAGNMNFIDQISWSYMTPLSAMWFTTWIIRYCIVILVLLIYGSVYYHVMKEYKTVSSKMDAVGINSGKRGVASEVLGDSIWYKAGQLILMLVFPDIQISAKLHGKNLNTNTDLENIENLNFDSSDLYDQFKQQEEQRNKDLENVPSELIINEERMKELQKEVGLDIQRTLHREAMEKFQLRRLQILRQMKVIFIYPLSYMLLWLFPFIAQFFQLRNGKDEFHQLWASSASAYFQAFNCTIDTIVFLFREQPWKLTASKMDPYYQLEYSFWRKLVSFLPGYYLGCPPDDSPSYINGAATVVPETNINNSDSMGYNVNKGSSSAKQTTKQTNELDNPLRVSSDATVVNNNISDYTNMLNLDDMNSTSDFVKRPHPSTLSDRRASSVDPKEANEMSLSDFLNAAPCPTTQTPTQFQGVYGYNPATTSTTGQTASHTTTMHTSQSQQSRRNSKFSWRSFSLRGSISDSSARKNSLNSSNHSSDKDSNSNKLLRDIAEVATESLTSKPNPNSLTAPHDKNNNNNGSVTRSSGGQSNSNKNTNGRVGKNSGYWFRKGSANSGKTSTSKSSESGVEDSSGGGAKDEEEVSLDYFFKQDPSNHPS